MGDIIDALPTYISSSGLTLALTSTGIVIGLFLGILLALSRISHNFILKKISQFYIWLFRGTPLMFQLMFIYFALPLIPPLNFSVPGLPAAIIALGLNSAAYQAEIIRAAIQSIDKGQLEASKALGMSYAQAMRIVIIPQSYRRLIPPVGNEFIAMLKDTAQVSVIALTELMRTTTVLTNSTSLAIYYLPCGVFYLAMTSLFTFVFHKLEKKYSVYE